MKEERVKKVNQRKRKPLSFSVYAQAIIEELKEEERFGTAHVYLYALQAFSRFVGGGEVFFGALSRRSLKLFDRHLRDRLCSRNTVSTYIRALRAIYNRAVDAELIVGEYRLFSQGFTGTESRVKLALPAEQIRSLVYGTGSLSLPADVVQCRDLFTLMLQLQGMPFTDLLHLRRCDLKQSDSEHALLTLRRQKTDTELRITVTDAALELLNKYRSTDPESPYLLRFIDHHLTSEEVYRACCNQLRSFNGGLAKLVEYSGLKGVRLSSYTARHSWATLAKSCGIPEEVISEGLGHSSMEITRTYLKSFESNVLDKANRMINEYILTGGEYSWIKA